MTAAAIRRQLVNSIAFKEHEMVSTSTQKQVERTAETSVNRGTLQCEETELSVLNDLQCYTKRYVQQQPETAALICLGIGFLLGWKLKPW